MTSAYKIHSKGIVVQTKGMGESFILVSPLESLSMQETGFIKDMKDGFRGDKPNVDFSDFDTEHTSKNYIRAEWRSIGNGNRSSAPDVVAGEEVLIFKFGNIDEYFWDELGIEKDLRRLEDVTYSFSNVPDGIGRKVYDESTSYWLRVSTREKFVHLHIADNDGEACTWDIKIDTAKGVMSTKDGRGNSRIWDAVAGTLVENFNTSITRNAPLIEDNCETHIRNTSIIIDSFNSQTINGDNIVQNGNVTTTGNHDVSGNLSTGGTGTFGGPISAPNKRC